MWMWMSRGALRAFLLRSAWLLFICTASVVMVPQDGPAVCRCAEVQGGRAVLLRGALQWTLWGRQRGQARERPAGLCALGGAEERRVDVDLLMAQPVGEVEWVDRWMGGMGREVPVGRGESDLSSMRCWANLTKSASADTLSCGSEGQWETRVCRGNMSDSEQPKKKTNWKACP